MLIGHGKGRFLCLTVLTVLLVSSGAIIASASRGDTLLAFGVFVVAIWALYLTTLWRAEKLSTEGDARPVEAEREALPPRLAEQEG